jgi:hypothetical protein
MNRREMIKCSAVIGGAVALSPAILLEAGCGLGKNADFYINLASSTLNQLSPLLPGAAGVIAKGVKVLADIKSDYDKGDFTNADALLKDLDNIMVQIQNDAGLNSPTAKSIFAIAAIAIQTLATLILSQPTAAVHGVLPTQMSTVEKLGSAARVNAVFNAVKF